METVSVFVLWGIHSSSSIADHLRGMHQCDIPLCNYWWDSCMYTSTEGTLGGWQPSLTEKGTRDHGNVQADGSIRD